MNYQERDLVARVIDWAYKGTGYNGHIPKDQLEILVNRFDQDDWHREIIDWGHRATMFDPKAYEPNEGATYAEEVSIFTAKLLRRIGEIAGDSEPYKGRANELMNLVNLVQSYEKKS